MNVAADKLRARNVELFRRLTPAVLERVEDHLDAADNPPPAPKNHKTYRFNGTFPSREDVDAQTFAFLSNLFLRADAQKIAFLDQPRGPEAFYLMIYGIPDDSAFETLMAEFEPGCFIIVEPDLRKMAASLGRVDWARHIFKMQERDIEIHFVLDDHPETAVGAVWRLCRRINPCRADNFASVIFDQRDDFGDGLITGLTRDLNLIGTHLGFFHDELTMLWNSYANLTATGSRIYDRDGPRGRPLPAFVVASGPSLDEDLDFIRDHQDRAVIISAGSALRPLLTAGIRPDFQVESENWDVTSKYDQIADDFDISDIHLVASATVEQEALRRFKDAVLFFRLALTPYAVFSGRPESGMRLPDPTVGNASLCFALEAGFEDIYVFGLDLGTRAQEQHHAQATYYNTSGGATLNTSYDIPITGNFRDRVWTSRYFLPAVKNAEDLIRGYGKDRTVYNCSDGADIRGAIPSRSADLEMPETDAAKKDVVRGLLQHYPDAREDFDVEWDGTAAREAIEKFGASFRDLMADEAAFADGTYQAKAMEAMQLRKGFLEGPSGGIDDMALILFRGTLLALFLYAEFYRLRVARVEDESRFRELFRHEILRAYDAMETHALTFLGGAFPSRPPDISERIAPPDVRFPPLRRLGRNEACYCGSGRKFKHCHGKQQPAAAKAD